MNREKKLLHCCGHCIRVRMHRMSVFEPQCKLEFKRSRIFNPCCLRHKLAHTLSRSLRLRPYSYRTTKHAFAEASKQKQLHRFTWKKFHVEILRTKNKIRSNNGVYVYAPRLLVFYKMYMHFQGHRCCYTAPRLSPRSSNALATRSVAIDHRLFVFVNSFFFFNSTLFRIISTSPKYFICFSVFQCQ